MFYLFGLHISHIEEISQYNTGTVSTKMLTTYWIILLRNTQVKTVLHRTTVFTPVLIFSSKLLDALDPISRGLTILVPRLC